MGRFEGPKIVPGAVIDQQSLWQRLLLVVAEHIHTHIYPRFLLLLTAQYPASSTTPSPVRAAPTFSPGTW